MKLMCFMRIVEYIIVLRRVRGDFPGRDKRRPYDSALSMDVTAACAEVHRATGHWIKEMCWLIWWASRGPRRRPIVGSCYSTEEARSPWMKVGQSTSTASRPKPFVGAGSAAGSIRRKMSWDALKTVIE